VVDLAVFGLSLDSMILKVFSNLNGSMILYDSQWIMLLSFISKVINQINL